MFLKSVLLSVAVATSLAGCTSQMEIANQDAKYKQLNTPLKTQISVPFNEEQARTALQSGSANIKGVLFHKITNGQKHNGFEPIDASLTFRPAKPISGVEMYLYPVTDHLLQLLKLEDENRRSKRSRRFSKDKQLREYIADPRLYKYSFSAVTDEQGRYYFKTLKPGRYYIVAETQDINTHGTDMVPIGMSDWGGGTVQHYRNQNYKLKRPIDYSEFVEIKPGQNEITLESRMRITKD